MDRELTAEFEHVMLRLYSALSKPRAKQIVSIVHETLIAEQLAGGLGPRVSPFLQSACMAGAALTVLLLWQENVSAGAIGGRFMKSRRSAVQPHWWVETTCGWILDPTIMQFSKKRGPLATRSSKQHVAKTGCFRLSYLASDDRLAPRVDRQARQNGFFEGNPVKFREYAGNVAGSENGRLAIALPYVRGQGLTVLYADMAEVSYDKEGCYEPIGMTSCPNSLERHLPAFLRMCLRLGINTRVACEMLGVPHPSSRTSKNRHEDLALYSARC
jgi:hypothetical protein